MLLLGSDWLEPHENAERTLACHASIAQYNGSRLRKLAESARESAWHLCLAGVPDRSVTSPSSRLPAPPARRRQRRHHGRAASFTTKVPQLFMDACHVRGAGMGLVLRSEPSCGELPPNTTRGPTSHALHHTPNPPPRRRAPNPALGPQRAALSSSGFLRFCRRRECC